MPNTKNILNNLLNRIASTRRLNSTLILKWANYEQMAMVLICVGVGLQVSMLVFGSFSILLTLYGVVTGFSVVLTYLLLILEYEKSAFLSALFAVIISLAIASVFNDYPLWVLLFNCLSASVFVIGLAACWTRSNKQA